MPDPRHPHRLNAIPPEARAFQGHRAGVITRTIASGIDVTVSVVIMVAVYLGIEAVRFTWSPTSFDAFRAPFLGVLVALGLVLVGVCTFGWSTTGRTPGDRVMGLRVVNFRGRRLRPAVALVRAVFCVGFPAGLFWSAISRENRSVQDVVLRTSVIHDWQQRLPRGHKQSPDADDRAVPELTPVEPAPPPTGPSGA